MGIEAFESLVIENFKEITDRLDIIQAAQTEASIRLTKQETNAQNIIDQKLKETDKRYKKITVIISIMAGVSALWNLINGIKTS